MTGTSQDVTTTEDGAKVGSGIAIALLSFTWTTAVLLALVGAIIAVPTLIRGVSTGRISALALAFLLMAGAGIVLGRRVVLPASPATLARPLAAGIAGAGILTVIGVTANIVRSANGFGWADGFALVLGVGTIVAAPTLSRWMANDGRAERTVSSVVTRARTFALPTDGTAARVDLSVPLVGLVVLSIGLIVILPDGPLGHDESIYTLKARSWTEGTPSTGWAIYRPIGMSVVAWVVLQFSSWEVAFRSVAVVISLAVIATMWFSGRIAFDRVSATVGAAVFMGTASFLRRATEFLNDVASAGLMLAAMIALWYQFERDPEGRWMLLAAPFAATAYYIRYGSALGLVIVALVAAVIWWKQILSAWRLSLATLGLLLALLVPHFAYAIDVTGSPVGVFETASTSVGGGGGGLADYLGWLPSHLAGPLGAALMAIAVVYLVVLVVTTRRGLSGYDAELRTVVFFVATAVVLTIALGAFTHGEPRFVFLPLMLMLLTGARAATVVWGGLRPSWRTATLIVASVVFLAGFAAGVRHMANGLGGITDSRDVLVEAADIVRADAGSGACEIRSSYIPQLTWYSACATYRITPSDPVIRPAYLVLFANGKRQPTGDALDLVIGETTGSPIATIDDPHDKIGDGVVFRYP